VISGNAKGCGKQRVRANNSTDEGKILKPFTIVTQTDMLNVFSFRRNA
jgi:hypothetical protein